MLEMVQPVVAEGMAELWAALHKATPLMLAESELHYLKALALSHDDEEMSHLLLKKLRLARVACAATLPASVVRLNSYVDYRHGGGEPCFAQLRHPSAPDMPAYGLSIASRLGVGLLGLEAGQSVLWPDGEERLTALEVLRVENCPGLSRWLEEARSADRPS